MTLTRSTDAEYQLVFVYVLVWMCRYLEDFEHVQVLGSGGFGLVFEARHRIDERHYAVKRVRVRTHGAEVEERERLLREVKAIARLEHQHIVRYYQAWFENVPADDQRRVDRALLEEEYD